MTLSTPAVCGERLYSSFHDDPDFHDLLVEFVAATHDRRTALKTQFDAGRWDELRRLAHQIKGAGGGYGFDSLSQVAARLEEACRKAEPSMDEICVRLDQVLDHLERVSV